MHYGVRTSPELTVVELSASPEAMIPFLRESYGDNYRGDDVIRDFFKRIDKVIGLQNQSGGLAVAAMIEGVSANRIIAAATSPNRKEFGNRSQLLTAIYGECRNSGEARWMSIGTEFDKVQKCATSAGMSRVLETSDITRILQEGSLDHHYDLDVDSNNLPVIITNSGHGKGKVQQVWAWAEHLPLN